MATETEPEMDDVAVSIEVDDGEVELTEQPSLVALTGEIQQEDDEPIEDTIRSALEADYPKRNRLDIEHDHANQSTSLWSVLKKNMGKKLSHVAMPVTFNEPLSALQRLCEELEHSTLLDQAAAASSDIERIMLVAAFAVSGYGSSHFRSGRKPFNPILGETYDVVRPERRFRFVAEQVSHHPPISVCVAESNHWTLYQEAGVKSSMRPSSLKITPLGFLRVNFPKLGEEYEWRKVVTQVEDIVSGNKWVDNHGKMFVTNVTTGMTCKVEFTQYSRFKKSAKHNVKGTVLHPTDSKKHLGSFSGKWTEQIVNDQTKQVMWTNPKPDDAVISTNFGFTSFAMELNQLPPADSLARQQLLPTDSRLRPDQRLWEENKEEQAAEEKLRVEELQRQAKAAREEQGKHHTPRLFDYRRVPVRKPSVPSGVPVAKETERAEWVYKGGFWKHKRQGSLAPVDPLW
eukprot:TRINITY_DN10660_c0_g1_i3.p1 TRINITY_DN10660_c0_g1~~TRINITY_DN10660_c0_g1_i3.p1  ORF type:complete len:480 (+),score=125.64 TRINITY_DN10660_c0_g1_i3:68-1441(+)